jgi:hypothetical protein
VRLSPLRQGPSLPYLHHIAACRCILLIAEMDPLRGTEYRLHAYDGDVRSRILYGIAGERCMGKLHILTISNPVPTDKTHTSRSFGVRD